MNGRRYLFIAERLLDELPVDEVEAVVAHEIGHLVHRHVARLGIAGVGTLAFAAAVLNGMLALASAWGMSDWLRGPLIGLTGAAAPLTALYVTRRMSRRFEFEADEYAAQAVGSPLPMAAALASIARENWLADDSRAAGMFASHPTIRSRLERLGTLAGI